MSAQTIVTTYIERIQAIVTAVARADLLTVRAEARTRQATSLQTAIVAEGCFSGIEAGPTIRLPLSTN